MSTAVDRDLASEVGDEEFASDSRWQLVTRVVLSPHLAKAPQMRAILLYLVRCVLLEQTEAIRENDIACKVLKRRSSFNPHEDTIVRVQISHLRKKLDEYFANEGRDELLVLTIPKGAYVPHFEPKEATKTDSIAPVDNQKDKLLRCPTPASGDNVVEPTPRYGRRFRFAVVCMITTLTAVAVTWNVFRGPEDAVKEVWSPILQNSNPALICIAQPIAYWPSRDSQEKIPPLVPWTSLDSKTPISSSQMVPLQNMFVGVGDVYAFARVAKVLTENRKQWRMLAGDETPSGDLKNGPIILIGAYSNPWTSKLIDNLRFGFEWDNVIVDRSEPGKKWSLQKMSPDWTTSEDYAIVSRFMSKETGQPVIVVAGMTVLGTEAGGEFVTDSGLLRAALRNAPKGWKNQNFQFVLHTRLLGKSPERPTVVGSYFWSD